MKSIVYIAFLILGIVIAPANSDLEFERELEGSRLNILSADTIAVQGTWIHRIPKHKIFERIAHGKYKAPEKVDESLNSEDIEKLDRIIEFEDSPKRIPACLCKGLFNVEFLKDGEVVFSMNYAHDRFSIPLTEFSQSNILEFIDALGLPAAKWAEASKKQPTANQAVDETSDSHAASDTRSSP